MAQYTYLIADLRSGAVLDELPLTDVTFTKTLNDTGGMRGKLRLSDPRIQAREPGRLVDPGRTALYVDREGVLVWGGVVWTTKYDSDEQALEVGAADFLSYFDHRMILPVLNATPQPGDLAALPGIAYTGEQLDVARALVSDAARHPGGDLGIRTDPAARSGVTVSRTYLPAEVKSVGEALRDLSHTDDGFDFVFDVRYDPTGRPERRLLLGTPRLGRSDDPQVWELGANLISYTWPKDAASTATRTFAVGAGGDQHQLIAVAEDTGRYAAGFPLLEGSTSRIDVADPAALQAFAVAELAARRAPVLLPELVVRADRAPVLGSYEVGDYARVAIRDWLFPAGVEVLLRLVGMETTPGDDGGEEQVRLTVSPTLEKPS